MSRRGADLTAPRGGPRRGAFYDPDRFGAFSEAVANFLGTAQYLVAQTALVIVWIALNVVGFRYRWDPYPFILLNLFFSTQASYAAPLILLAQNRAADRERLQADRDREVQARTRADTEFLARELASISLAVGRLATEREVRRLAEEVERLRVRLDEAGD